ncbi:IstB-like ATP binding protein [Streptomyces melanosporofaciens]|uniref:IstB-like ATP binding protein n=1 Tax=Streptomyces melanosporofaciens TaxID=67327 RepID=A0A1H4X9Y8_STRMJ|nr:IstB-like ATP binding protein [Streptomyces melanosporofaciens]
MNFFAGPKLLVIDELGYLPLPEDGASALFQVINQRYLKSSTILTTNVGNADWAGAFGDATVAAAMLGRLLHRAAVAGIDGPSYWLRGHQPGRDHPSRGERPCLLTTPPTPPRSRPRWPVAARSARPSSSSPPPPAARSSAHPPAKKPTARTNPFSRPARPATPHSPPRSANAGSTARTSAGPPPAPARTPGRNEPAPSARALSMRSRPPARSTVHRPAAKTPNADATKPGTKTGPAASARHRHRRHCRSCHRSPNRSAERHHANQPWNATRWSRPRPGTVRTASSRSPSSRCLRPRKPPAPLSPRPSPTSFRCEGLHDHPLTVTAHRARRPDGRRAHTVRPSNATGPIRC